MSENEEITQEVTEAPQPPALDVGACLAEAREAKGMSIEDAAQQLRRSVRQLEALEANDYSSLQGATFVRGFVRNYARMLGIDAEPLLQAVSAQGADAGHQAITLQSEEIAISNHDRRPWAQYAIATGVVALLLGAWLLYSEFAEQESEKPAVAQAEAPAQPEPGGYVPDAATSEPISPNAPVPPPPMEMEASAPAPVAAKSSQPTPAASSAPTAAPVAAPVKAESKPEPKAADAAATVTASAKPATATTAAAETRKTTPAAGTAHLKLAYSQATWVRVYDRDEKLILHKNASADTADGVDGMPPLRVEIGNAAGVQVSYKDKPVDLTPHTKANIARFTLE